MTTANDTAHRLGQQFFDAQDRLRGGPDPALCTPGYRATIGGNPAMDRAGHEGFSKGFYTGLPDARHHVEQIIATDDRVVVRFVIKGTHTGNFFGIPATGRSVTVAAHVILHVEGGKVAELYGIFDEAGLLKQMGVLST